MNLEQQAEANKSTKQETEIPKEIISPKKKTKKTKANNQSAITSFCDLYNMELPAEDKESQPEIIEQPKESKRKSKKKKAQNKAADVSTIPRPQPSKINEKTPAIDAIDPSMFQDTPIPEPAQTSEDKKAKVKKTLARLF